MRAYSIDLREKIVQAVESGRPKTVVAELFGVGRATVDRYVRQHRATGDLRPKRHRGAVPLIRPEQYPALIAQVQATPDATLAEHCETWERTQGVRVSIDTMRRALLRIDWRRKKRLLGQASKTRKLGPCG